MSSGGNLGEHLACARRNATAVQRGSASFASERGRRTLIPHKRLMLGDFSGGSPARLGLAVKLNITMTSDPKAGKIRAKGRDSGFEQFRQFKEIGMAVFARVRILAAACAMLGMAAGGAHAAACGKDSKRLCRLAGGLPGKRGGARRSTPRRSPTPNTTPASSRSTATSMAHSRARSSSSSPAAHRRPTSARPRAT